MIVDGFVCDVGRRAIKVITERVMDATVVFLYTNARVDGQELDEGTPLTCDIQGNPISSCDFSGPGLLTPGWSWASEWQPDTSWNGPKGWRYGRTWSLDADKWSQIAEDQPYKRKRIFRVQYKPEDTSVKTENSPQHTSGKPSSSDYLDWYYFKRNGIKK